MPEKLLQEGVLEHPLGSLSLKSGVVWEGAAACPKLSGVRALAGDVAGCSAVAPQPFRDSHPHIPDRESKIFSSLGGYCGKAFGKHSVRARSEI